MIYVVTDLIDVVHVLIVKEFLILELTVVFIGSFVLVDVEVFHLPLDFLFFPLSLEIFEDVILDFLLSLLLFFLLSADFLFSSLFLVFLHASSEFLENVFVVQKSM